MMPNIEKRKQVWNDPRARAPADEHDLVASLPYPFEDAGIRSIFDGRDVLEIGPGRGRQYERLRKCVKSYCIADVSSVGLKESVFASADERFLMDDWGQTLPKSFDVIHFWYVLHHIMLGEMTDFFGFVYRNLRQGGLAAFNCPTLENVTGTRAGDGFSTTYSDPIIVWEKAAPLEMLMALPIGKKATGYVFLLRKTSCKDRLPVPDYFSRMVDDNNAKWAPKKPVTSPVPTVHLPLSTTMRVLVHFEVGGRIACMPGMTDFRKRAGHPGYHRTSAKPAVTCPWCRKSDIFNTV